MAIGLQGQFCDHMYMGNGSIGHKDRLHNSSDPSDLKGSKSVVRICFVEKLRWHMRCEDREIFYSGALNTFAFEFADKNRAKLKGYGTAKNYIEKFEINATIMEEFYQYCSSKDLSVNTKIDNKTSEALKPYLKAFIGRDIFDKDAYYPILNQKDRCILKATEVLSK